MGELVNSFPDFTGSFGDKRIDKRAGEALAKLTYGRSSSIRQVTESEAEQKSFYRLFNNESFSEQAIEQSIIKRCSELCAGRHLLCIQDTTEFNLSRQQGRIQPYSGLGTTSNADILGFMLHSSLTVDATSAHALGFSSIKLWERKEGSPDRHQRNYQKQPIEHKESYKWISAAEQSANLLGAAKCITIVADRESDIYDLLVWADGEKKHLLIRSNHNRSIANGNNLTDYLNSLPVMHTYTLSICGDVRKEIKKRTAQMNLKWSIVVLKKTKRTKAAAPVNQQMYVVEAKEQHPSKGIYWRLLTSHPVTTSEQAMQIISWYKQRWHIEQIHRLLKTEGFRIERSQLEQGWAIRKLTMLAMMATLRILQMMLAYDDENEQVLDEVFDQDQQQCLRMINKQLEGNTEKQKNTAKQNTLKWATWIIARLGGWKGYKSQRKPGPIVLQKGLSKFYNMFEGWRIYQSFTKDVSTP